MLCSCGKYLRELVAVFRDLRWNIPHVVLWDCHTANAGKVKTRKESPWGAMYTLTQDARCVGCFKAQGGQGSGLTQLKSAGEKPKHYIQNLEKQLNPSYQGQNAQNKHHTHATISYPLTSKELRTWAWIWLPPQFKSGLVLWFRSNNTNTNLSLLPWHLSTTEQKSWDCLFL